MLGYCASLNNFLSQRIDAPSSEIPGQGISTSQDFTDCSDHQKQLTVESWNYTFTFDFPSLGRLYKASENISRDIW
jgi:hypothetical protein